MACTGRLSGGVTAILVLGVAAIARAAGPCEEGRGQTGLALAVAPEGLAVAAVDIDSPAAAGGLRTGDAVAQVNGVVLRTCGEYARAVRDARDGKKALLLLVRGAGGERPALLAASTWQRAVAAAPPSPPPEPPSVRSVVAKPPPPPLPPETHVTVEEVTRGLGALAPAAGPTLPLATYRRDLTRVQRQVETLVARGSAPADVLAGLRTVFRYYDAARVAYVAADEQLERERRPRHLPPAETATAPFFADSEAAAVIDEFPFLRATVTRDPGPGAVLGESAGRWRPLEARALLWERGRQELDRLTAWLAASG